MKKKLLIAALALTSAFGCAAGLSACDMFGGGEENNGNGGEEQNTDFTFQLAENGSGYIVTRYDGTDAEVTIPAQYYGAPVIALDAPFNGNEDVTKVVLPDSVIRIGNSCFANTAKLKEVVFSGNLEIIEDNAFYRSGIEEVALPASMQSLGPSVFYQAKNLTSFTVEPAASLELIDIHTFNGCSALTTVQLPDGLKTVSQMAFTDCTALQSVEFKHVEVIETNAFANCTGLAEVDFGDSLINVDDAFAESGLTKVILPDTCTKISGNAFIDCVNVTEVYVPENAEMSGSPFKNCNNVEKITFPAGNYLIRYAFGIYSVEDASTVLTKFTTLNVVGQKGLTENFASGFSKLANINVDDRIGSMGANCFTDTAWYGAQPEGLVYAGNVLLGYKGEMTAQTLTVKEGTLGIADEAFTGCSQITAISLPEQLKNIGESAFEGCNLTGEVVLPSALETLGDNSLKGNDGITKLTLSLCEGSSISKIFSDIPQGLTEITVNGSYLPARAFYNMMKLEKVTLSDDITEIPDEAFYNCAVLTELVYGDITKIGEWAFTYCNSIIDLVIPDSVTEVAKGAFCNMANLESATFGENLITLGESAFAQCKRLRTVAMNDNLETVGAHAFENCQMLTKINFGSSLKNILNGAFEYCYNLENVKLNSGLLYIGQEAFTETKLTQLIIPESVTYVGARLVYKIKSANLANFKLLVEATEPNAEWDKLWNLNRSEVIDDETIYNNYPTYYYSETDKTDGELLYWHYVEGEPVLW